MNQAPSTLAALITQQAVHRPQAVYAADAQGTQVLTYGALARSCAQVCRLLRAHGTSPGDTVSVVMPNGLMTLRLLLGALAGGWCVNPVNLLAQSEQMDYVIAHSDCKLVFTNAQWEAQVRQSVALAGRAVHVVVLAADAPELPDSSASDQSLPVPLAPHAVALLMYTSGTTGKPKGVLLTQANLMANAHAIGAEHALGPTDRVLAVLPLYHINAFAVTMLAPLAHGGSLVMPSRFSATAFWGQAHATGCTWINLVPTMISYLLEAEAGAHNTTAGIRFCRSASAALPPEHLRAFERKFGIGIVETMGLTETAAPSFSNPLASALRKTGSVGRASGCEACVIDRDLRPVADGVTGEIAIRGPNVMLGYYKDEKATAAAFTLDGWLRTGDLGHRDPDGFYFVTGRIKELIIKGGENIAPREIDEALLRHPAVLDAAAVGIADPHYGQEIMVCVVLRAGHGVDVDTLRAFCTTQLGAFKTPRVIRLVQELPRGPSGKVQRLKLLELGL